MILDTQCEKSFWNGLHYATQVIWSAPICLQIKTFMTWDQIHKENSYVKPLFQIQKSQKDAKKPRSPNQKISAKTNPHWEKTENAERKINTSVKMGQKGTQ